MLRPEFKMADLTLPHDCIEDSEDGSWSRGSGDCDQNSEETFRFHQDENTLSPAARLEKYALSENILSRQMVPSILLEILRDASPEALTSDIPALMETLVRVSADEEMTIRTDLIQRIPHLAAACFEYSSRVPALANVNVDHLLPIVVRYLGDTDNQIRKFTYATLLAMMEQALVPKRAIEVQVCPKVLQFTLADTMMDYQTGATTLMGKMVPLLGRETTERMFLVRFTHLCSHPMFYIRKICASSFGEFCAVVGSEAYENLLLPCFIELCRDEVWGVRKACAEVIMTVSCACSPASRKNYLAGAFAQLLYDQSRWVQMSAFQILGPFISTFADPSIIGLTYNHLGELVLINPEGTEFRIDSPAFTDANLKAAADFKQVYYQAQEGLNARNSTYGYIAKYDMKNPNEADKLVNNSLMDRLDVTGNTLDSYNSNGDINSNKSLNLLQNVGYTDGLMEHLNSLEETTDLKNIPNVDLLVNGVKVELNDKMENKSSTTENENSESTDKSQTDDGLSNLTESFDKIDVSDMLLDLLDDIKKEDEDNLEKYNQHQYWYISPEMPLDPNIVRSCKNEDSEDKVKDKFMEQLDDLTFNSSWNCASDETVNDPNVSSDADSTKVNMTVHNREQTHLQILDSQVPHEIVPQMLINHFISMTDNELASKIDIDLAYHCAFSLPAVALTLGRNNWHLLKKTCETLAADMQYKVRKTIASSLHELALILGQELAGEHLVPLFDGFFKDLDEVRIGILKHLAHFLKLIGPEKRNLYLPRLAEFLQTDNEWNWRFREELANQLLIAIPLFQAADASKYIVMLAQELLCDKVFAVRRVALALVTELVRHMSGDPKLTTWLLMKLAEEFAHSKRWVRRQAFALLCSCLISSGALPPEKFAAEVMPHLLDLSWDPVPNVRLAVSRTLARNIIVHEYFMEEQQLQKVLRRMQSDKDRDVRHFALLTHK